MPISFNNKKIELRLFFRINIENWKYLDNYNINRKFNKIFQLVFKQIFVLVSV